MSSTSNPSSGSDAVESHLTVEDTGSTTNAADLFHNDTTTGRDDGVGRAGTTTGSRTAPDAPAAVAASQVSHSASDVPSDPGAPSAPSAPEAPGAPSGLGAAEDDFALGHVFDQTNGIIEGLDGDSDGTADSDALSGAERDGGAGDTRITGS